MSDHPPETRREQRLREIEEELKTIERALRRRRPCDDEPKKEELAPISPWASRLALD
jgi:hypothetical protein